VNPAGWDERLEDALKRRTALRAPPDFTSRVMRRAMEGQASPADGRTKWLAELDDAATVLIVLGLALLWNAARLGDWLGAGIDTLRRAGGAMGSIAGAIPPAPLVLAALAGWLGWVLVSTRTELLD
jgi:hypothetical protein